MTKTSFAVLVVAAIAASQAQAAPFGFAANAGPSIDISQGYQGFDYTGGSGVSSWINDKTDQIDTTYGVGPTQLGAAWSNGGTNLILTSATPGGLFDFDSVSLDVGHTENVTVDGLLKGNVVDSWTGQIVNQATYTNLMLNWSNVDTVTFSQGANLFVTNIDAQHVPEPASLALFGAGLLGLAMISKKNKRV